MSNTYANDLTTNNENSNNNSNNNSINNNSNNTNSNNNITENIAVNGNAANAISRSLQLRTTAPVISIMNRSNFNSVNNHHSTQHKQRQISQPRHQEQDQDLYQDQNQDQDQAHELYMNNTTLFNDTVGLSPVGSPEIAAMREWWRTRSLNAPSPIQQFGPCGRIMINTAMVMQIQDPASQRLTWYKPPLTVLVIKKVRDTTVLSPFVQLVEWLVQDKHMVVWVESAVLDDPLLQKNEKFQHIKGKLVTFKDGRDDLTDRIDFIICLGGDGTLLYASLLFQQSVPPVMAFHLGSLGFLTPFQFHNFQDQVTNVLEGHAALTLRSRLRCAIYRKSERRKDQNHVAEVAETTDDNNTVEQKACGRQPSINILVLNEVVIDRGPSPYLSNIDLFLDGKYITSVQGDGLIVSTPTGSTAYAVAAGASMIHPSVPAIMVTPICPHSLSFRPIVVPAGVELKISISPDSRNTSWVSFDGRNRQELLHGDSLRVTTSRYPVPSICAQDQITDWFDSLAECLHWNVRKKQKCLDELSDLTASGSEDTLDDLERSTDVASDN